jgi:hypothetical protein
MEERDIKKEKSEIMAVVELLEENGYHVFKAEEDVPEGRHIASLPGAINLRISMKGGA